MQRVSHHINRRPSSNLHHATKYASQIGLPLSHFVTVNFTQMDIPDRLVVQIWQKFVSQRFSPWLRRSLEHSVSPTYVWVAEAAGACTSIHWLVHIPKMDVDAFKSKIRHWFESLLPAEIPVNAIDVKLIDNIVGLKRYILKGSEEHYISHYGINHVPQGCVYGRRAAHSRNLGPVARKRVGYRSGQIPFS